MLSFIKDYFLPNAAALQDVASDKGRSLDERIVAAGRVIRIYKLYPHLEADIDLIEAKCLRKRLKYMKVNNLQDAPQTQRVVVNGVPLPSENRSSYTPLPRYRRIPMRDKQTFEGALMENRDSYKRLLPPTEKLAIANFTAVSEK